jgi:hypothetical protein
MWHLYAIFKDPGLALGPSAQRPTYLSAAGGLSSTRERSGSARERSHQTRERNHPVGQRTGAMGFLIPEGYAPRGPMTAKRVVGRQYCAFSTEMKCIETPKNV